jgi:hypothetical protein
MSGRLYVDTSAYLCVLLGERGAAQLARTMRGAELLSSVVMVLEAERNLIRLVRDGSLLVEQYDALARRLDEDVEVFTLRDATLDVCRDATMPAVATPRSMDLLHLRTAMWFHRQQPIDRFVTMDARQAVAAREVGLRT